MVSGSWAPRHASIVGPERARGRDRDEDPPGVARIQQDRVQAHPAGPWLPVRSGAVVSQPGELVPRLSAVARAEQGGVLHARVHGLRIGQRRLDVPDALELPGMRRSIIPLVRARHAVVGEPVAHRLPRPTSVTRTLDDLPEPTARLRCVQPVWVGRRALDVIDLPAAEVRAADLRPPTPPVRRQEKCTLPRTHQDPYSAHALPPGS
jgi:hypothetical protein